MLDGGNYPNLEKKRSMKEFLDDYYVACQIRDQNLEGAAGLSTHQASER